MSLQTKATAVSLTSSSFTASVERRVLHYIRKRNVIAEGERIVVAVSGGPDSTALLLILSRLATKLRLDLTVAHFNHQLRTESEATEDLDFVRSLALALDCPFIHSTADVRAYAHDNHLALEDAARRLRYAFLAEQASASRVTCVALGHTLDDQAETVLLHLIRGAGLSGVSAMAPRGLWPFGGGPTLARPLVFLRRQDTERYCREAGLLPRIDPTNDLLTATRNQVRHEVLPVLRRLNPRIDEALARFAENAGPDSSYLNQLAAEAFDALSTLDATTVSLDRARLSDLPRPLAARVVQSAFAQVHGTNADLEAIHIGALIDALCGPPRRHSLPGGIVATIEERSLILGRGSRGSSPPIPETALVVPGHTTAGQWRIEAELISPPEFPTTLQPTEAYLDAAKTGANLTVRSRRPGDRLHPLGLGGEKKLQDILVDAKVPARERDGIPLVCAGQIGWVVGHCIDERYALSPASLQAIHLIASWVTPDA